MTDRETEDMFREMAHSIIRSLVRKYVDENWPMLRRMAGIPGKAPRRTSARGRKRGLMIQRYGWR